MGDRCHAGTEVKGVLPESGDANAIDFIGNHDRRRAALEPHDFPKPRGKRDIPSGHLVVDRRRVNDGKQRRRSAVVARRVLCRARGHVDRDRITVAGRCEGNPVNAAAAGKVIILRGEFDINIIRSETRHSFAEGNRQRDGSGIRRIWRRSRDLYCRDIGIPRRYGNAGGVGFQRVFGKISYRAVCALRIGNCDAFAA